MALMLSACGSSVRELQPKDHRRQFKVECVELEQCKKRATAACGTSYEIVSEWHNTIPESDLPGLNESSRPKDWRDHNNYTFQDPTGIESKEPMPLSSLVVACNG
jgi:hypothetical protein